MSLFNSHSVEILILLFFIITYFLSVTEKLSDWKGTIIYYTNHFKKTVLRKIIPLLLLNILIFEIIALILLVVGLYFLVNENSLTIAKIGLEISAITLLQFLIGQRLTKDYQGAMNITVYFILNSIGIYLLT
ncbi:DoxX family protein [Lutibacter profundi]|uniref:DoxX family protein n=1 Tax=Lutibacter profundi TaxID=1622118 RepID=A0A0X8G760_9FLAO|nr:DoxX family protein [Lutibacter profundi]AMC11316.1 DoxX family protein [Lutibacter profundi]